MSLTIQPVYGTYDYEAQGAYIEELTVDDTYTDPGVEMPRSDVGVTAASFLRPRGVSLRGLIALDGGGTRDALRVCEDAFHAAHRPGVAKALYRDNDRFLMAQVTDRSFGPDTGLSAIPFSVRFKAVDPFWYASAPEAQDTWATPANAATRTITNGGAVYAAPLFTFTASSTGTISLTLTNAANGLSFGLTGSLTNGDVVLVDTAARLVKKNGALAQSLFSFPGTFFGLEPGANLLTLALAGVTLASIKTDYTKRWL